MNFLYSTVSFLKGLYLYTVLFEQKYIYSGDGRKFRVGIGAVGYWAIIETSNKYYPLTYTLMARV